MLDDKLKPWLIEVNNMPSFATDTPLDEKVKSELMLDTFKLLNLSIKRKKKLKREKQAEFNRRVQGNKLSKTEKDSVKKLNQEQRDIFDYDNCGGYTMIYPNDDFSIKDKYDEYISEVHRAWSDFSTGMSRTVNVSLPKKEALEKYHLPHSP